VLTVDGFLASANVEVVEAEVVDTGFKWSDHNPVYMEFILK
jgi:exonuclease III